jgi:hypothetical protein
MVMVPPAGASGGVITVMTGFGTSNGSLLLLFGTEFTVTLIGPVVVPEGTVATICVSVHVLAVAGMPLKVTVLSRWLAWKPVPLIVTEVPTSPPSGQKDRTDGGGTANWWFASLLALFTLTITGPEVAVTGTVATICESDQLPMEAGGWPLKVSELVPCVAPKATPLIVTCVPTGPVLGETLLMALSGTV